MSQPEANFQRRWFQFSLRSLLVVTAAAAALAFAYAKLVEPYRLQREAMAAITRLGGTYKTEDAVGWIKYLEKNVQDVVVVDLADCDRPDEYVPHLARLPRLRTLIVGGHSVGDEQVAALGRAGSLKGLVLDSTLVTGSGVEALKETLPDIFVYKGERRAAIELRRAGCSFFQNLDDLPPEVGVDDAPPEWLCIDVGDMYITRPIVGVGVWNDPSNADLAWLASLSHVRSIEVGQRDCSFLDIIAGLPALARIHVSGSDITDADLALLSRFPNLADVYIGLTDISDNGIPYLEKCTQVTLLNVWGNRISKAGVQRLKTALPHCVIED